MAFQDGLGLLGRDDRAEGHDVVVAQLVDLAGDQELAGRDQDVRGLATAVFEVGAGQAGAARVRLDVGARGIRVIADLAAHPGERGAEARFGAGRGDDLADREDLLAHLLLNGAGDDQLAGGDQDLVLVVRRRGLRR